MAAGTHTACTTFSGDGHVHRVDIDIYNYFELCREPQALHLLPSWSTMDLRTCFWFAPNSSGPPPDTASQPCLLSCLHGVFSQPNCWKNLLCFWTSLLSEGKWLIHTLLFFAKQTLLTACNSPRALARAWNFAQGPLTHRTGRELWALPQPEGLHRKEGRILHSRLIYYLGPWICTSSLHSPPSQNLDCRKNVFLPYCVCAQGYSEATPHFHEVISWHLAECFLKDRLLHEERRKLRVSVGGGAQLLHENWCKYVCSPTGCKKIGHIHKRVGKSRVNKIHAGIILLFRATCWVQPLNCLLHT